MTQNSRRNLAFFTVLIFLSLRLWHYVNAYTSQLPYMDQWDVYRGYFDNYDFWQLFRIQHGSHRQGLGAILTSVLFNMSNMNLLWETRAMALILILNSLLALNISRLYFKSLHWWDLMVPLIVLNLSQYEIFAGAPNPAHGVLPQFLILLMINLFFINSTLWKSLSFIILLFFVMNTGYGYFAVFAVLLMCLSSLFRPGFSLLGTRRADLLFLLPLLLIMIAYYMSYAKPMDEAESQNVGLNYLWKLPFFAAGIVSRGLGASRVNFVIIPSLAILIFMTWEFLKNFKMPWKSQVNRSLFFLLLTSFLYLAGASWGRAPGGMGYSITSRYVPFVSLVVLAFYWLLRSSTMKPLWKFRTLLIFALFFSFQELRPRGRDNKVAQEYLDNKKLFVECYREKKDFLECNKTVYSIYPEKISSHIPGRLQLMEERNLAFFRH